MIITPNLINLGEIHLGIHKFSTTITNDTDSPVSIISILPGCGSCSSATMSNMYVAPNTSEIMTITFNPISTGFNQKTITLTLSTGENKIFTFTANVKP